jgi:hypothetical protein
VKPAAYVARQVARAMLEQTTCRAHLERQLRMRRPVSALAKEAEGLYSAYRNAFRGLGVPARTVQWLLVGLAIRAILQPADP